MLHIKDEWEVGQSGMVGFDAIFKNAELAGLENFVVEIERYSYDDIRKSFVESADYLLNAPFVKATYAMSFPPASFSLHRTAFEGGR